MITIDHINMTVKSLPKSIEWYNQLFGFEVVEEGVCTGKSYAILRCNDSMLCLYESDSKSPAINKGHRMFHFGLRISEKEVWLRTIDEKKIKVHSFQDYPHSLSWYIMDPTGHEVEITYWKNGEIKFDEP